MPSWRCPHCSTPQAEASRCWVCHRSSTSCGTCREFRTSVAARFGYCGLDRTRRPLRGDEVRACWQDGALPVAPDPSIPGLLDLLTVRALGSPRDPDSPGTHDRGPGGAAGDEWSPASAGAAGSPERVSAGSASASRRSPTPSGQPIPAGDPASRRLWVEVEV